MCVVDYGGENLIFLDQAQYVGSLTIGVRQMGCDGFYVESLSNDTSIYRVLKLLICVLKKY
jgi:hypothetical protein